MFGLGVCYLVPSIVDCCSLQRLGQYLWIFGCLLHWIVLPVGVTTQNCHKKIFNLVFHFSLAGGEKMIGLPPLIHYPMFNYETGDQMFPFRTMSMILSMISLLGISHLTWVLFNKGHVSKKWDLFGCFDSGPKLEPSELMAMDPSGTKKYTDNDDDTGGAGAVAAAAQATIEAKKPIRKPDPNLRALQRQISFGSGAPLIGIGSLKKKQMSTGMCISFFATFYIFLVCLKLILICICF